MVKNNVLINSMQHDEFVSKVYDIQEKDIVFLETNILGTDEYETPDLNKKNKTNLFYVRIFFEVFIRYI